MKKIYLENFKLLYTNKKSPATVGFFWLVQLKLDFLISQARGSRGRCGLRKTEKIFSANNEQGTIKRGEKWFPEKLWKKLT